MVGQEEINQDAVELPVFEIDVEKYAKWGKHLDNAGLTRTGVTVRGADDNPMSSDPKIRRKGIDANKAALDCCQAAGATALVGPYHSALGYFSGAGPTKDEWNWAVEGMRELLGVPERPLLIPMIKPSIGLTPQQSAKAFYEAALGGADGVKDDELVVSHPWSHFLDRVREHEAAAKAAYEETGQRTLYFVNVTDRPDRLMENAHRAIEAGASALMVNYLTVGISSLSMIADDPAINVPVLAHLDFSGAIYGAPWSGVSSHLILGKLPRLAGADVVVYPSPYGKFPFLASKHLRIAQALTTGLHDIKRSWPMPGGGVQPGMLPLLFGDMGRDFVVGAGGAVHGHPQGPVAGARALRQAIDSVMSDGCVQAEESGQPELAAALAAWGICEVGVKGDYDRMKG